MEEATRQRCCEPHFSTKRDNALHEGNSVGMGLGLSFVQAILQHHDATIEIQTIPGAGSTFRLLFPLAMSAEAATNSMAPEPVAAARPS
jgi:signal transduction histidine kinase